MLEQREVPTRPSLAKCHGSPDILGTRNHSVGYQEGGSERTGACKTHGTDLCKERERGGQTPHQSSTYKWDRRMLPPN